MKSMTCALAIALAAAEAGAVSFGANIVTNGDAETGDLTGWTITTDEPARVLPASAFTFAPEFDGVFDTFLFTGGRNEDRIVMPSAIEQTIDLSSLATEIDGGGVAFDLGATMMDDLTGFSEDRAVLSLAFSDGVDVLSSVALASTMPTTGPEGAPFIADEVSASGVAPVGARQATLTVTFTRTGGRSSNGVADNISLVLEDPGQVAPIPLPASALLLAAALGLGGLVGMRRR